MYSNNDFRSYSERDTDSLQHWKTGSAYMPTGTGFDANGKNTSEYNHIYYLRNKWRWGVDAAKGTVQNVLDKTDIDEKIAEGAKNLQRNVRGQVALGKYNAKRMVGNAVGGAKRRINTAINNSNTKLDDRARDLYRSARNKAFNASGAARAAGYNAKKNVERTVDNAKKQAFLTGGAARAGVYNTKKRVSNAVDDARRQAFLTEGSARAGVYNTKKDVGGALSKVSSGANKVLRNASYDAKNALKNAPAGIGRVAGTAAGIAAGTAGLARGAAKGIAKNILDRTTLDERIGGKINDTVRKAKDAIGFDERTRYKAAERYQKAHSNDEDAAANLSKRQDEYNKTILSKLDKASSVIGDLTKRATRAAGSVVGDTVNDITNHAKNFLGYDEKTRYQAAERYQKAHTKSQSAAANMFEKRAAYERTPLAKAEKAFSAAREAYSKALDMYGEGSKGAIQAAKRLAAAAGKVTNEAKDVATNPAYNPFVRSSNERLSRAQRSAARADERIERQLQLAREQRSAAVSREKAARERDADLRKASNSLGIGSAVGLEKPRLLKDYESIENKRKENLAREQRSAARGRERLEQESKTSVKNLNGSSTSPKNMAETDKQAVKNYTALNATGAKNMVNATSKAVNDNKGNAKKAATTTGNAVKDVVTEREQQKYEITRRGAMGKPMGTLVSDTGRPEFRRSAENVKYNTQREAENKRRDAMTSQLGGALGGSSSSSSSSSRSQQDKFDQATARIEQDALNRAKRSAISNPGRSIQSLVVAGGARAASEIKRYVQAADKYGPDSRQAIEAYNDALDEVEDEIRSRDKSNRY